MDPISELKRILGESFVWNKARMDCFVKMLLALIKVRTVNLREIAVAFNSSSQIDSRYKRLKRFCSQFTLDKDVLAKWAFKLFFSKNEKVYITIDRTNWYWGKSKINILTLAIAHEGLAIPLFWKLLNTAGNAKAEDHTKIINRFISVFGKDQIAGILADREFGSEELFNWLSDNEIPFYIRIKSNTQVRFFYEKTYDVKMVFKNLKRRKQAYRKQPMFIFGQKLFVAAGKNEKDELLIVATNQSPENAVPIYLRRWEIESLFQSLKGRGFCFEETHLTKKERISNLMSLLMVGFCWAHKVGEWRAIKKPVVRNKYKTSGSRPQYSYFRYGYDFLRDTIFHLFRMKKQFKKCLRQLFPPEDSLPDGLLGAKS